MSIFRHSFNGYSQPRDLMRIWQISILKLRYYFTQHNPISL